MPALDPMTVQVKDGLFKLKRYLPVIDIFLIIVELFPVYPLLVTRAMQFCNDVSIESIKHNFNTRCIGNIK